MKAIAALLLVVATPAAADESSLFQRVAPTPIDAAARPCDAARTLGDGPAPAAEDVICKKIASRSIDGVGTASLYAITEKALGFTRYALLIDGDGGRVAAPPIDLYSAAELDLTLGKVTAKLRAITVDGAPAVAVELQARFRYRPEGAKAKPFTVFEYVVCGAGSCATAELGGVDASCRAHLSRDGILTHACDQDTRVPR